MSFFVLFKPTFVELEIGVTLIFFSFWKCLESWGPWVTHQAEWTVGAIVEPLSNLNLITEKTVLQRNSSLFNGELIARHTLCQVVLSVPWAERAHSHVWAFSCVWSFSALMHDCL